MPRWAFQHFCIRTSPDGGPVYPMGTLGIRLAFTPVKAFTFQTAIFEGNKFAQNVNRYGFRYSLNPEFGYFWITRTWVRWFQNVDSAALAGTFKAGAWVHTARFANPIDGELLDGNYGFYFIVDQILYRQRGETIADISGKDDKMVSNNKEAGKVAELVRAPWVRATGSEFHRILLRYWPDL